jgi:hypothetical protein
MKKIANSCDENVKQICQIYEWNGLEDVEIMFQKVRELYSGILNFLNQKIKQQKEDLTTSCMEKLGVEVLENMIS